LAGDDHRELESDLIKKLEKIRARLSDIFFNLADDLAERNEISAAREEPFPNNGSVELEPVSIELTPVDSSKLSEKSSRVDFFEVLEDVSEDDNFIKEIEKRILKKFNDLDESFMYLGILKNLPLPDSSKLFEEKFEEIIELSKDVWKNRKYPARKELFVKFGEDYENIENLIHANDALDPIYEGLKQVYEDLEQLRDSGVSFEERKEKIKSIFSCYKAG